jgi:uncharacterized membrane protein
MDIFNSQDEVDISQFTDLEKKSKTYVYECQSGNSFVVNIEGRMAWVFLPEQTVGLPKISSASGVKYTDGQSTFWNKGNKARFERRGTVYKDCVNNPGKAIWENAKLNGADFRAVGNEPGWHLEIMHDKELVFTSQYGKVTHSFSTSIRSTDSVASKTDYHAQKKGDTLSVTISGVTCQDTMSDETYESTVTVMLDSKAYQGCGKALH